jgi:hypothetical protein
MINVRSFLDKFNIPYQESGSQNVGKGWLGLPVCPSCGRAWNCYGVNTITGVTHCWVCSFKSNIYEYVKEQSSAPIKEVYKEYKNSKKDFTPYQHQQIKGTFKFPMGMINHLENPHKQYLKQRGFDPEYLETRYDLKSFTNLNPHWAYRIIIPIYMNNILASYVGRTIYKQEKIRYKNAAAEDSLIPAAQCLYGIDEVGSHAVLVEGLMDRWTFGSGAIATMGVEVTNKQIAFLKRQGVEKVTVLFDNDGPGKVQAENVANKISLLGVQTNIFIWDKDDVMKDVGECGLEKVDEIRSEVFS